jgi:hypothetical protein
MALPISYNESLSKDGVPPLLETPNGVPSSSSCACGCVEPPGSDVDLTRMVWESISSLIPSLGQARWNISPLNRPLGFVKSKPSKPPRDGLTS